MSREENDTALQAYYDQIKKLEEHNRQRLELAAEMEESARSTSERFKSFIDSTVGAISDSFFNFPSNISELRRKVDQEWELRKSEERETWRRWTGSEASPEDVQREIELSSDQERAEQRRCADLLLFESLRHNAQVPVRKIIDLYRDEERSLGSLDRYAVPMLSFGGACYYKPETVENLPSTARWGWPAPKQRWLGVEWFKRDSYSPIQLEAQNGLSSSDINWRAAFEELLCATLDKPMISGEKIGMRPPYGRPQSTYHGPGLDWMLSLQCRGILPPQIPSLYRMLDRNAAALSGSLTESVSGKELNRLLTRSPLPDQVFQTSRSSLRDDYFSLVNEIAIRSGPESEAQPRSAPQTEWEVPDTEEELYEQMPPTTAALTPPQRPQPYVPAMTGNEFADFCEIRQALRRAKNAGDLSAAIKCINTYSEEYDAVERLFEDVDRELGAFMLEAFDHSDAPFEPSSSPSREEPEAPEIPRKPEILSQLTRTETTRLPDGTVTTKVVLKQRFADGREETRESVQTDYEPTAQQETKPALVDQTEQPKKQGWFWS